MGKWNRLVTTVWPFEDNAKLIKWFSVYVTNSNPLENVIYIGDGVGPDAKSAIMLEKMTSHNFYPCGTVNPWNTLAMDGANARVICLGDRPTNIGKWWATMVPQSVKQELQEQYETTVFRGEVFLYH